MTDHFALLNEPRRPWLDTDALKTRFLALSAEVHPDRVHAGSAAEKEAAHERFALLNTAYNCLRDPKTRLLHLLELELGARPKDVQRIPPGTMELFVEVGQLCRQVDTFLAERAKVTAPMLRVGLFEQGMEWTDRLNGLQQRVNARREELLAEVQQLNAIWEGAPAGGSVARRRALPLERLELVYRVLSYISRWSEQLQERVVQLAMD
jgi:DnaJ-domain-containing protein 1